KEIKSDKIKKLNKEDEAIVRKLVYQGRILIGTPRKGKWALYDVLNVPKKLYDVYEKNKEGTIRLLISIMEGARPRDAMLAGGFAVSLMESPVKGASYVQFSADTFDSDEKGLGVTARDLNIRGVKKIMEEKLINKAK